MTAAPDRMANPVRAVFLNQGTGGRAILGHHNVEGVLRGGVEDDTRIRARFLSLGPLGGLGGLAMRPLPGLRRYDLDLQTVRWHLVHGLRARAVVAAAERAEPVDVLHVHSHAVALTMPDHLRRTPTVLSVDVTVWDHHTMGLWRPLRRHSRATLAPSLALERRAFAAAALVVAWSAWARDAVLAASPGANVAELHPGIDLARFRPSPRPSDGVPRVLFVGSHFEQKGGRELMAALGPAIDGGDVQLDVVTQSPLPTRPGVTVHRLAPGSDTLVTLLGNADVFCLPTRADASPWAVLEAMACGLPVVAASVGGVPDLVGQAGLLVPPQDPLALSTALDKLLADVELRTELGRSARERTEARFDARTNTRELVDRLVALA